MVSMVRAGIIGLGKMGISHLSILNAHPDVTVVGACDSSSFVTGFIGKVSNLEFYTDYRQMLKEGRPDCVMVVTPTSSHASILRDCLEQGSHVFVEKPFCLSLAEGESLVALAEQMKVVNQVGYHYKFVGTFAKAKELLHMNALGDLYAIHGEAYGPVALRAKGSTWRSQKNEGGGCLHDYTSHVVDLMNYYVGLPSKTGGTILKRIFSSDVEDAVYSTLFYESGIAGQLSVNWSEPSYRKMSTMITLQGTKGKIIVDRQEIRIYLNEKNADIGLDSGWTVQNITELTPPVWFYLRGEEYSSQVDYFVNCVSGRAKQSLNTFRSALDTDRVIDMLVKDAD
jgi:scyllo-inositol 2-dehydrogenase (NADP+)